MARITSSGPSNEPVLRFATIHEEGRADPFPGTSSLKSESTLGWNGPSGTTDRPSPALDVESPFAAGPAPRHQSSTADTTDGAGQETGSSPSSPSDSSEEVTIPTPATPAQDPTPDSETDPKIIPEALLPTDQIMAMAREAYFTRNFDESERLLNIAETLGEDPTAVASARGYVAEARARSLSVAPSEGGASGGGFSEEDPSAGGALVP